ncbi:MAG: dockerin type I domain-containing protein [Planctomycetota bacterium]|nr:dockerin type I domain-containing protein [Planctomycetota bacterium]
MLQRITNHLKKLGLARRAIRRPSRRLTLEPLESRSLFAGLPFGVAPEDTGEFMLGRIAVTPVFLESTGQIDPNTENWTPAQKTTVLNNIQSGLNWWKQLLATKSTIQSLDFVIDTTYVDTPAPTPFEPISRVSNAYSGWVSQFLVDRGFSQSSQLDTNMRAFNNSQRVKLSTDWSFTIFVVNSQNDGDGNFAPGGSFDRAFSFAGGLFQIVPSTRPASTFTHETGHMFWARDEYIGGSNYFQKRGYYNSQNTNAIDLNPTSSFVQVDSIMSSGGALDRAFQNVTTSDATLAQIGWVDSDNDGIFDVLDVPLKLEGLGQLNSTGTTYSFVGRAVVQTLPNVNSSGLQNDITINRIGRIEYRFNSGIWQTFSTPNDYQVDLNLSIDVPAGTTGAIEIRAIESSIGITSNIFSGTLGPTRDTASVPGIQGFAWSDVNRDGKWQSTETGIANARVRLVDNNRQPLVLQSRIEPDNFSVGSIASNQNGVLIEAIGEDTNGTVGVFTDSSATTGSKVFRPFSTSQIAFVDTFRGDQQQLRITFAQPTTSVAIDAIAGGDNTIARLDAYSSNGKLIRRFQSGALNTGGTVTMQVGSDVADIAFVIARGIRNSKIKLDNLVIGPATETKTSVNGNYVLPGIPTGTYQIEITPQSPTYDFVQPSTGLRSLAIVAGTVNAHADFSLRPAVSPWQNQVQRQDVNNDGLVSALDVLVIINEINRNGARPLENSSVVSPLFYDVDGNRNVEALDVLIVINFINSTQGNGEGESLLPDEIGAAESTVRKRRKA